MARVSIILAAMGASFLSACASTGVGGPSAQSVTQDCARRTGGQLATLAAARQCIDDYRVRYARLAAGNASQRQAFRAGTLIGSLGAVANALTDGSEGATTGLGLLAGGSATLGPIVAPPARVSIYLDGQSAANCLYRESATAMHRHAVLTRADVDAFILAANALSIRLDAAPTRDGATADYIERFAAYQRSIRSVLGARDAVLRARARAALDGDLLMASLIDADLAVQLRLHQVDLSLEASVRAANQTMLTLAGELSQRPDLFELPAPEGGSRSQLANDINQGLETWWRGLEDALGAALNSAERIMAELNSLDLTGDAGGAARCVDLAAGLSSDVLVLRSPPVAIDLGETATHTLNLDVDGGNAPYTAEWVGAAPDGLTLAIADSGTGTFTITTDPTKAKAGRAQLILRDEELRPLLVMLRITGTAPAAPAEPAAPATEGGDTPAASATPFRTAEGNDHAVCRIPAGGAPDNPVAIMQAGICNHLATRADFGQTDAGYTFMVDGDAGPATDAAARAALTWREITPIPEARDALYASVCTTFEIEGCPAAE